MNERFRRIESQILSIFTNDTLITPQKLYLSYNAVKEVDSLLQVTRSHRIERLPEKAPALYPQRDMCHAERDRVPDIQRYTATIRKAVEQIHPIRTSG